MVLNFWFQLQKWPNCPGSQLNVLYGASVVLFVSCKTDLKICGASVVTQLASHNRTSSSPGCPTSVPAPRKGSKQLNYVGSCHIHGETHMEFLALGFCLAQTQTVTIWEVKQQMETSLRLSPSFTLSLKLIIFLKK